MRAYAVTTHKHTHDHPHPHADKADPEEAAMNRVTRLAMFLETHFGDVELHMPEKPSGKENEHDADPDDIPGLLVNQDDAEAFVNLTDLVMLFVFVISFFEVD